MLVKFNFISPYTPSAYLSIRKCLKYFFFNVYFYLYSMRSFTFIPNTGRDFVVCQSLRYYQRRSVTTSILKAPLGFRRWSQEQYSFKRYFFNISFFLPLGDWNLATPTTSSVDRLRVGDLSLLGSSFLLLTTLTVVNRQSFFLNPSGSYDLSVY